MDNRIEKMARVLVHYSVGLKPGERLLIRSTSPAAEPLCQALYAEALRVGGLPSVYIHMSQEDDIALEATGNLDQLAAINPMLELMYNNVEAVIRIEASENTRALSTYPLDQQRARSKHHADLITIQMRRQAAKTLKRCTTQFPTHAYAQTAGMSLSRYADFLFGACKVEADDPVAVWQALHDSQQRLIDWLKGKEHVHVRGEHVDLELSIKGRVFANADGKHNFPDGEIFTGPVEDSVNGWVRFTYPAYYRSNEVSGIRLEFKDGLVVKATADANEAFLNATLDTDAGSRRLGEFAIGNNWDIQQFTGSILFDEKIGGTVHMAVGQGYAETGSVNESAVHWDMICDMRTGGEIIVDDEVMVKDGKFVI
jgi:aminopeptidase